MDKLQPIKGSPAQKLQYCLPIIPNAAIKKQEQNWVTQSRYVQVEGDKVYSEDSHESWQESAAYNGADNY